MDPNLIIEEIERYSAASGLKETTVCQRALNNAYYLDRLRARLERGKDELARIRSFIAANPPATLNSEPSHDPASSDAA